MSHLGRLPSKLFLFLFIARYLIAKHLWASLPADFTFPLRWRVVSGRRQPLKVLDYYLLIDTFYFFNA